MVNIISYATLNDKAAVWQQPDDNVFRDQMTREVKVYLFQRKCGDYVHNLSFVGEYASINAKRDNLKMYCYTAIDARSICLNVKVIHLRTH